MTHRELYKFYRPSAMASKRPTRPSSAQHAGDTIDVPGAPSLASLPEVVVLRIIKAAAAFAFTPSKDKDKTTLVSLLCASKRIKAIGYGDKDLWRDLLTASGYEPTARSRLAPTYDLDVRMSAFPREGFTALLRKTCSYCSLPGTYWFTLHHCRVCQTCFTTGVRGGRGAGASLEVQYPVRVSRMPNCRVCQVL